MRNSTRVNKFWKHKHCSDYGRSKFRSPRHPYKSKDNRTKRYGNGCRCCVRDPKIAHVNRMERKANIHFYLRNSWKDAYPAQWFFLGVHNRTYKIELQ